MNNEKENTQLAAKVSKLEELTRKLSWSLQLTNEAMTELTNELFSIVKEYVKEEMVAREKEIESNVITTVAGTINETVRKPMDEHKLSKTDLNRLHEARTKRMRELLGDSRSDEYKLFIPFYQGRMSHGLFKKFNVITYANIAPSQFKEALDYIQEFNITDRSRCVDALHTKYRNNGFSNNELVYAYERYFGITA